MTAGTKDKIKLIVLCVLGAVALYMVYATFLSGPSGASQPESSARPSQPPPAIALPQAENSAPRPAAGRDRNVEFHPVLHSKRAEDRIDPRNIDPTLRLDLLAKVQAVELAGGARNLFQVGPPPPPKADPLNPKDEPKVAVIGPRPPQPPAPPPPELPPPPIPLKYYGVMTVRDNGKKTACFLDGDDILIAAEGEMLKRRYKVVRISPGSALMEDTESKRQQTLPLAPEAQV